MKIVVGTLSDSKIDYLKSVLNDFSINSDQVGALKTNSGVSEQPFSEKETILGAMNRSKHAFEGFDGVKDCAIGLEGGLEYKEDLNALYYLCVASIYCGSKNVIGVSSKLKVPHRITSKIVEDGAELADEIRALSPKNKTEEILIEMIISRKEMFQEAIRNALLQSDLFTYSN